MLAHLRYSMKRHGHVGDTRAAELAYLSILSALLDQPVPLLIKGASGAGKSFALKVAKRYVPNEAYTEFHAMSEKALAYMGGKLDLKHRTLIIQEAAGWGSGDGRVFLRQLLTEGKISYATVMSTKEGLEASTLPSVEGPCSVIMTTTSNVLHREDENRFLSCTIEEGPDHIRDVLIAIACGRVTEPESEELKPFHDLYLRIREERPVVEIPFAASLAGQLPTVHKRVMRDFPKILSLIRVVAMLEIEERKRNPDGSIVAKLEDYEAVRSLLSDIISEGLESSTPPGVVDVVKAVEELEKMKGEYFGNSEISQRHVSDYLGCDPGTTSRNVGRAILDGYLVNQTPGRGSSYSLVVGSTPIVSGNALPEASKLFEQATS